MRPSSSNSVRTAPREGRGTPGHGSVARSLAIPPRRPSGGIVGCDTTEKANPRPCSSAGPIIAGACVAARRIVHLEHLGLGVGSGLGLGLGFRARVRLRLRLRVSISSTSTSVTPRLRSSQAATSPEMPAPTMTTCTLSLPPEACPKERLTRVSSRPSLGHGLERLASQLASAQHAVRHGDGLA
eukprot:scaffold56777_cov64-Phaeocystis_antarctica.AAC.11